MFYLKERNKLIHKKKSITKSYKLSYEPVQKGWWLWKKTEHCWVVVRSLEVHYVDYPTAPNMSNVDDVTYKEDEEEVVKAFPYDEKNKAIEMSINLNKRLTCEGQ